MKLAYDLYTPMVAVNKDSAPIILLHSIVENKNTWKHIGPILATDTQRRVYALDLRNHGDSSWTDEYNIEAMSKDLKEFLDTHSIAKIVLIGHSLGGKVAISFALKEPTKVEKLIVEDVAVKKIKFGNETLVSQAMDVVREALHSFTMESDEKEARSFITTVLQSFCPMFNVSEDYIEFYPFELLPLKWTGKSMMVELNLDRIITSLVEGSLEPKECEGKFEGEALFIAAEKSQFKVHKDKLVEKHFPRFSLIIVEDCGHFVHQIRPNEFISIVTNFINQGISQRSKY